MLTFYKFEDEDEKAKISYEIVILDAFGICLAQENGNIQGLILDPSFYYIPLKENRISKWNLRGVAKNFFGRPTIWPIW